MSASPYFNLASIVAEEERIPVTFNTAAAKLGYLDASDDSEDIEAGCHIELPLWLAEELARRNMVKADIPKAINPKTRRDLLADASAVVLRDKSPTFYELGHLIPKVSHHIEARRFPTLSRATLAHRARIVMDRSHNSLHQDISEFTNALTDFERRLFERGYNFAKERLAWKQREMDRFAISIKKQSHKL